MAGLALVGVTASQSSLTSEPYQGGPVWIVTVNRAKCDFGQVPD